MNTSKKIGIISISDERPNAYNKILPIINKQCLIIQEIITNIQGVEPVVAKEIVNSPSKAREAGKYLAKESVIATIYNLPTFGFPKFGMLASLFAPKPFMLISQIDSTQPSPAGLIGLGGAMTQVGIMHERIWGNLSDSNVKQKIKNFILTARTINDLRGLVLGLIGGRSMGLYPMVSSSKEIYSKFGIDIDHIDQSEIIRRSKNISDDKVNLAFDWLLEKAGSIQFNDVLTESKLKSQIRNYEALKEIISHYQLDFAAVKCHYEMSEFEQPLCIAAMFSNDPYDWNGKKQTLVYACEADVDGAITMQILKLLSLGKPTCLLDLRYFDDNTKTYLFQNCGVAPSWFAGFSDIAEENLKHIKLCSCVPKFQGGGAQADFWFREGEYTLARLYQTKEGYHMLILKGTAVSSDSIMDMLPGEENWPKLAIKIDVMPDILIQKMNSIHMHAVLGNFVEPLILLCKYLNIIPEVMM